MVSFNPLTVALGENLRTARTECRISQPVAAARMWPPCTSKSLSEWENGRVMPSLARLVDYCRVLSTSVAAVLPTVEEATLIVPAEDLRFARVPQLAALSDWATAYGDAPIPITPEVMHGAAPDCGISAEDLRALLSTLAEE